MEFLPLSEMRTLKIFFQVLTSLYRSQQPKVHGCVGSDLIWSNSVFESLLYSRVFPSSPGQKFSLLSPMALLHPDEFGRCAGVSGASSANGDKETHHCFIQSHILAKFLLHFFGHILPLTWNLSALRQGRSGEISLN